MSTPLIITLSCLLVIIVIVILIRLMIKSLVEADSMMHIRFLEELDEYKKKAKAENE